LSLHDMEGENLTDEHLDRYVYEILASGSLEVHPITYLMNAHG
jgi:hypothetical protein